jgi:hypothetical protein
VTPFIVFQEVSCSKTKIDGMGQVMYTSLSPAYELKPSGDIVAGAEPRVEVDLTLTHLNALYNPGQIKSGGTCKTISYIFLVITYGSKPEVFYYAPFVLGTKNSKHSDFFVNWGTRKLAHPRVTLRKSVTLLFGNGDQNGVNVEQVFFGSKIQEPLKVVKVPSVQTGVQTKERQVDGPFGSKSGENYRVPIVRPVAGPSFKRIEPFPNGNLIPFGDHQRRGEKRVFDQLAVPTVPEPVQTKKMYVQETVLGLVSLLEDEEDLLESPLPEDVRNALFDECCDECCKEETKAEPESESEMIEIDAESFPTNDMHRNVGIMLEEIPEKFQSNNEPSEISRLEKHFVTDCEDEEKFY